ncbi:MAG: F0F1 ATP synthase subunit A [Fibrobacter sp.]|nr:F0F1 ATP synthase subunit A [Fibrobacter sp.]
MILGHVTDGNEWQILPLVKPVELHSLNFGLFSIPVTRHVVMLLIVSLVLITVMVLSFRKVRIVPSKMACCIEPVLFFVRDSLVYPSLGKENGEKLLPFFYTLFFFLLTSNILGMIPMFSSAMGNLSITLALAIIVFMLVVYFGMKKHGFLGYFRSMIPSGIPKIFAGFFLALELVSLFIRNGVLAIRLFANMVAGHIIIFALLIVMFIVGPMFCVVSVPLALFVNLLEVLVAVIQAVVFTLLSAIFIGMSFSKH